MTKENRTTINNPQRKDSSSKLIFGDNILCSQFLRDYADMEILRNIQPEDIVDVSERYVPLYSTERDSDTVKRVNIGKYVQIENNENTLDLPLFIVSLVEHKTKVEYNVAMQILRYMIHIWEDYEKEMNKKYHLISARKDFRYPPILPIVYYEGKRRWTAPLDLADRIFCKELLGDYLPHFKYQMVGLHDYSNEELLDRGDEISLAMLINKIEGVEDMEAFRRLPDERMDEILRDTPEYLLDIMEKLLRALLYSMNLEQDEAEITVSKIKERKMARLFENVTFDFQEEKRKMREATEQADRFCVEMQKKMEKMEKEVEKRAELLEKRENSLEKREKLLEERMQRNLAISRRIARLLRQGCSDMEIKENLINEFNLSEEQADEACRDAFEN